MKVNYKKQAPYILGAGLLLYLIFGSKKNSNQDTADQIDTEAEAAESQGLPLSYPLSNYFLFADTLQSAMFDLGTNESKIYAIFNKLNNARDLLQLIKSFGLRPYYQFGWNQGNYNLGQWFGEELSITEYNKINQILQDKGINYQF